MAFVRVEAKILNVNKITISPFGFKNNWDLLWQKE